MNSLYLFGSALWVLGLAVITTSLGWRLWQFRIQNAWSGITYIRNTLNAGGLLFCLGISLTVGQLWASILFTILASAFALIAIIDKRSTSKEQH